MRQGSFVAGILGGALALLVSLAALLNNATPLALHRRSGQIAIARDGLALVLAILLLLLAVQILTSPHWRWLGAVLIIVALGGFVLVGMAFLGGGLAIVGGILALCAPATEAPSTSEA